jgi:hypothetical protein
VEEAPAAIEQLIEWGAAFDREGTKLLFAREGAHSRNRVLHAHGDSTGRELVRAMRARAASFDNIRFQSFEAVTDLLMKDGAVGGVLVHDDASRSTVAIRARAVLLATGGLGRVFENTTNPDVSSTPPRCLWKTPRDFSSAKLCAAKELIFATPRASVSWIDITSWPSWLRATWFRVPLSRNAAPPERRASIST